MDSTRWRKSRRSGSATSNCIETAASGRRVAVRDSTNPDGGQLRVSNRRWEDFARAIKSDQM